MSMPDKNGIINSNEPFNSENVKKIKEEAQKKKGPLPKEVSGASVEQRETETKRDAVISLINTVQTQGEDMKSQREDINRLNESMQYVADKMGQMAKSQDEMIKVVNQLSKGGNIPQDGVKGQLSELLDSKMGEKLIDRIFPDNTAQAPLIDQNTINEKMKASVLSNLETGESINEFIKNAMKKSVTKTIINTSLKDIGTSNVHEPS